jgi:hypothetical protein
MIQQGFNQTASYNFFGFTGTTDYPEKYVSGYTLVRFGKQLSGRKSLFFVAGLSEKGEVTGFKNQGYSDFLGLLGSSDGPKPRLHYSIYQASAGYQFDGVKSRAKLGAGPSLFLVNYSLNEAAHKSLLVPGALLTGRFPFGKERKLVGIELVMDIRLAPPVKLKSEAHADANSFSPGRVNMCSGSAGIALNFRKKP